LPTKLQAFTNTINTHPPKVRKGTQLSEESTRLVDARDTTVDDGALVELMRKRIEEKEM